MHYGKLPVIALLVVVPLQIGCGRSRPTQVGGKPVEHWIQELKNPDAKARKHAVAKLGNVGPSDPAAWPAIRATLDDADPTVRAEAILAVLKFGKAAQDAIPTLTRLKNDADPQVRDYAAKAITRLQSDADGN